MKRITNIFISALLLASLHAVAAQSEDAGKSDRDDRRRPRRRYYTKRINIFDKKPQADLEVREEQDKNTENNLIGGADNTPLKGIGTANRPPRPRPNRPVKKSEDDDGSNWIVDALTGTDSGEEKEEDPFSDGWGWLAQESKTVANEMTAGDELSEEEQLQKYLEGDRDDVLIGLIQNEQLDSRQDKQAGKDETNGVSSVSRENLFVDFEKTAQDKFNVFRPLDEDFTAAKNAEKEDTEPLEEAERKLEDRSDTDVANRMNFDKDMFANDKPRFADAFDSRVPEEPEDDAWLNNRDYSSNASRGRDRSDLSDLGSPNKFKSAFDNDSGRKFKSPFEESYNQRGLGSSPGNTGYRQPEYAKPLDPIGGGYGAAQSRRNQFEYNRDTGSLPDTVRDSRQRLPNSINQWD